jgi:hypothetical protein
MIEPRRLIERAAPDGLDFALLQAGRQAEPPVGVPSELSARLLTELAKAQAPQSAQANGETGSSQGGPASPGAPWSAGVTKLGAAAKLSVLVAVAGLSVTGGAVWVSRHAAHPAVSRAVAEGGSQLEGSPRSNVATADADSAVAPQAARQKTPPAAVVAQGPALLRELATEGRSLVAKRDNSPGHPGLDKPAYRPPWPKRKSARSEQSASPSAAAVPDGTQERQATASANELSSARGRPDSNGPATRSTDSGNDRALSLGVNELLEQHTRSGTRDSSQLREELLLLDAVRRALQADNRPEARRLLVHYRTRFGRGYLAPEAGRLTKAAKQKDSHAK